MDLWMGFLRHLPVWVVVVALTWLTRVLVGGLPSLGQLLLCVPVGLLGGAAFILGFAPQRRIAANIFSALRGWYNDR
jgi:hypothetical protein